MEVEVLWILLQSEYNIISNLIVCWGYVSAGSYGIWNTVNLPLTYTLSYSVCGNAMFSRSTTETSINPTSKTLSSFQWAGSFREQAQGTSPAFNWVSIGI